MLTSFRKVAARFKSEGLPNAARYAICRVDGWLRTQCLGVRAALQKSNTIIPRDQLGYASDHPEFNEYAPSQGFYTFRKIMIRHIRPTSEDVLLDYGSGLGRILLMAGMFPFRRVIGIEFSRELSARSEAIINGVRHRLVCKDIRIETADASHYALPDDVTVIYFFNSFAGEVFVNAMSQVKASLSRSPRRLRILSYHPRDTELWMSRCNWLRKTDDIEFQGLPVHRTAIFESSP